MDKKRIILSGPQFKIKRRKEALLKQKQSERMLGLETLYPNTVIVLKILLTMPVTVAGGERSFSKLKLIKTYLRSRLSQEKLNSLAILAMESELASTIRCDSVLKFTNIAILIYNNVVVAMI
jgi:hypothetical protein